MRTPCNECPFLKSTPLVGAPDWVKDVVKLGGLNPFFEHSCHQTDPVADGFKGAKKKMECAGHQAMMVNDIDGTPGLGGVYESREELLMTYLEHWLGKEKLEELRQAARADQAKYRELIKTVVKRKI